MKNFNVKSCMKAFMAILFVLTIEKSNAQEVKLCVIADIHYFNPELLISDGTAFQTYLAHDRKMLQESEAILESVLDSIKKIQPDVLIVAGDLTKDGEMASHSNVAAYFDNLEQAGIEVIVTPGNHDINNPHAVSFDDAITKPVPSVTPEQFDSVYANFGFDQAIARDTASLSFVYNVNDSLTIISMDVCDYDSNFIKVTPVTQGLFKENVLDWILDRTAEARNQGRVVMGVMHHGILEHYIGQTTLFGEYVVNDWANASTLLADTGMNVVFTGHYHSQDIALKETDKSFIFDMETGSTVTYPCPYRTLTLSEDNFLSVSGDSIQKIDYELDTNFQGYAKKFLKTGLNTLVSHMLVNSFGVDAETAAMIEPAVTESFIAHYQGDESDPSPASQGIIEMMLANENYQQMGYIMQQMWIDTQADWEIGVQLTTHKPSNINTTLVNKGINIYPNPSQGSFTLEGSFSENIVLNLYSLSGKRVYSTLLTGNKVTVSPNISRGIYVAEITDGLVFLKKKIIITE